VGKKCSGYDLEIIEIYFCFSFLPLIPIGPATGGMAPRLLGV
jgi:hypothetical protein